MASSNADFHFLRSPAPTRKALGQPKSTKIKVHRKSPARSFLDPTFDGESEFQRADSSKCDPLYDMSVKRPKNTIFGLLRVGFFECQPRKTGGVIAATPMIFFAGNTSHTRTFSTRKVVRPHDLRVIRKSYKKLQKGWLFDENSPGSILRPLGPVKSDSTSKIGSRNDRVGFFCQLWFLSISAASRAFELGAGDLKKMKIGVWWCHALFQKLRAVLI